MALRKRINDIWFTDFTAPDGRRIRRCTGTRKKREAQEYHDRLKAELWRVAKLGDKPDRTWREAVVKWLEEMTHKATLKDDRARFIWLDPHLGDKKLGEIDRETIVQIAKAKKDEKVSDATVNRYMALIRAVLRRAWKEWEWTDRVPKVPIRKEPNRRVRYLSQQEANRLLKLLPPHLSDMAQFTLATGLREQNVCKLSWEQVDMERRIAWIHPDQAKARRAIRVPLGQVALDILSRQVGNHPVYVFTHKGEVIRRCNNTGWRNALVKAGIENFRWHDLRHTWASWAVMNGTPIYIVQELGGWESPEMVRRYAHLAPEHLAKYADAAMPVG